MRYLLRLLCVCALCLVPVVGCFPEFEFRTRCEGVNCDDGNECTRDYCILVYPAGTCGHELVANGTACELDGGASGVCRNGVCNLCYGVVCEDDGKPCTRDRCDPNTGRCGVPADDGTVCEYKGLFPGFCASGFCAKSLATGSCQVICDSPCQLFNRVDPDTPTCLADCMAEGLDGCVPETTAPVECAEAAQNGNCDINPEPSCGAELAAWQACE